MSSMEDSDEALVGRYVRGDAAAFDQLYKRHELRVWRYLERNVRNQATSDELLQEIWSALSRNAASLESATRFRTRLFTLTHDRMSNSVREQPPAEAEASGNRLPRDAAGLAQAIAQLPREQREAFLLQAEGQLSVGEIAEITEATIDATQNSLRLAKLQIRDLLGEGDAPANADDMSDVEQIYRRLSGVDAGRPGEWVRRKVQAYSAQQAAERSVRDSAKTREAVAPVAAAPAPTPKVAPAPVPKAATPAPKQGASKPWLLPVIGAGVVVVLVAIFVVPSLKAPGGSVATPPPPPVSTPNPTPPPQAAQTPSVPEPSPPAQSAEPAVASSSPPAAAPASPPPAPAQVAQSSEEPRAPVSAAPAPAATATAANEAHAQTQPKTKVVAHQPVASPPTPPVASTHTGPSAVAPTMPAASSTPAPSSTPVAAPETRQASIAPPPAASPPVAAAPPLPAPTPVSTPAAAAHALPPPDDFFRAAETGDMGRVREVLDSNVDLNAFDAKGRTALILAIGRGHADVVKALLAKGADANKVDSHGMTPKAAAHSRGNFEIISLIDKATKH